MLCIITCILNMLYLYFNFLTLHNNNIHRYSIYNNLFLFILNSRTPGSLVVLQNYWCYRGFGEFYLLLSSYFLTNINNLGAMAVSSEFKVFDLCGDVYFIKYC